MTRFEELTDLLYSNKHKKKIMDTETIIDPDTELEVSGLSPSSGNPLAAWGNEETDPDLIDQLYMSYRSRANRGENASSWD
jgi:hypothetical protein